MKFKPLATNIHGHAHVGSLDGASTSYQKLLNASEQGRPTDCLTDHGLMSGLAEHWFAAEKISKDPKITNKVKSIHGIEVYLIDWNRPYKEFKNGKKEPYYYHLTIHFKTQKAYQYFCSLTPQMENRAIVKWGESKPLMTIDELKAISGEVTIGSGCMLSPIGKNIVAGRSDWAIENYELLRAIAGPGNFWVEVMPHEVSKDWKRPVKDKESGRVIEPGVFIPITQRMDANAIDKPFEPDACTCSIDLQKPVNEFSIKMATKYGDPVVISLDDHFAKVEDEIIQRLRLSQGEENWRFSNVYAAYDSDHCAKMFKKQLGTSDSEIEKWIDNGYQFIELFNNYKFLTSKDQALLPRMEDIYEIKTENTGVKLFELIEKHGRMPKTDDPKYQVYKDRLDYELSVLRDNGKFDLLPYFFLVEDAVSYLRSVGATNAARGCLTGDTLVRMSDGSVKELKNIEIGDSVISHTGHKRLVTNFMKFEINESLLKIKSQNCFNSNIMTSDHKILITQRNSPSEHYKTTDEYFNNLQWIQAGKAKKGDLVFHPWIKDRKIENINIIDLLDYTDNKTIEYDEDHIYEITKKNEKNDFFSVKGFCKKANITNTYFRACFIDKTRSPSNKYLLKINTIIQRETNFNDVYEWISNYKSEKKNKINRFILMNEDLSYMIGKWVGDGWVRSKNRGVVGFAFNRKDDLEINKTVTFFKNLGFNVVINEHKQKKLTQILINSNVLTNFFRKNFPNYKNSSSTKYFSWFKFLPDDKLKSFIDGYISADGHKRQYRYCVDSTSLNLIHDMREALLYLKTPSSLTIREPFYRGEYLCKKSYKLTFYGGSFLKSKNKFLHTEGYFAPISSIEEVKNINHVYDITVEKDHSYLTIDYAVHNSAGGVLIAYLIGLTMTDPIKYELPFERFITLDKILKTGSMPDFDLDIDNRDVVLEYLRAKYKDKMALISTDMNIKLKYAIKDTERMETGVVEESTELMCKKLPQTPQGMSTTDWLFGYKDKTTGEYIEGIMNQKEEGSILLKEYAEKKQDRWNTILRAIGITRSRGIHAGGVIITPEDVSSYIPLIKHEQNMASAYEMKALESIGVIKYDFLGLDTLWALGVGMKGIKDDLGIIIPWEEFPHDDNVYREILHKDKLAGVFQLNTKIVRPFIKQTMPRKVKDLAALTALCRPGCLDAEAPNPDFSGTAADYYVAVAQGKEAPYFIHPSLKSIFQETNSICVYQEQSMRVFNEIADYTLDKTDDIRKAIGKKNKELMDLHLGNLRTKCLEKGWTEEQARQIVETLVKSASYAFNKSHSTAYAIIAYNCCWLKYHYPLYFWKGILTVFQDDFSKIANYLPECAEYIGEINVLISDKFEWKIHNGKLIPPLSFVKGAGDKGVDTILNLLKISGLRNG